MKRIFSVLFVIVLVVSSSGSVAVAQTDIPAGMVGVPDANVSEDVPLDSSPPLQASDLEGSVMASNHAESLEVIVTTPDRASDYLDARDSAELSGSKGISLVLQDDVHSAGRDVAIDAGAVQDALGYTPKRVYGTHEDGEAWSRDIEYQGGMLIFEVPHFSSNSVTFSSEISVNGTFSDGATASYGINSIDSVSNFSATVTGIRSTEVDSSTHSGISGGSGVTWSLAGNAEPRGPSGSGEPKVSVTPESFSQTESVGDTHAYTVSDIPQSVDQVTVDVAAPVDGEDSRKYDVTVVLRVDGSQVGTKTKSVRLDSTESFTFTGNWNSANSIEAEVTEYGYGGRYLNAVTMEGVADGDITLNAGGQSKSFSLSESETGTLRPDLSTGDHSISVSNSDWGTYEISTQAQEATDTVSPAVSVNGYTANHIGALSDGETASLSMDDSWVESGTNTVNVTVGDGSLSADAPAPSVRLNYTHEAQDKQDVQYTGTKWTESYNVSKTFSSDRSVASLTVPFATEVVEIKSLETRTNGGSWSSVPESDYSLNNTELTVELGAVDGGDEVAVRTTGQQVLSVNSSITVTEATAPGDRLDTRVRVKEWNEDSSISVGRTEDAGRIHYTYNESWDNADEHVEITAGGTQKLHLPGAGSLSSFRVRTVPVRVNARSGEVEISVQDPSTTGPSFYVSPGATENDDVEYTLLTASDGEEYILRSETNNVVHDSAEASSPVTLIDDDSEELLVIEEDSTTASEDDGPSQVGIGPAQIDTDTPLNSVPVILLVGAGILVALAVIYRRLGWSVRDAAGPIPVDPVFALAAGLIAFVVIDYVGGGVLTGAIATNIKQIGSGISQIVPLLGIGGAALLGYWLYQNFILGDSGGGGGGDSSRTIIIRDGEGNQ